MKNTIKLIGFFIVIVLINLAITACATTGKQIAYDESLPNDKVALIHYWNPIPIIEYNGISVNWKAERVALGFGVKSIQIKIPGGDTVFILNGTDNSYNVTYNDVPFKFNFENGKEYTIVIIGPNITIYNGNSYNKKNNLATFNMYKGQTLTESNGKKVTN